MIGGAHVVIYSSDPGPPHRFAELSDDFATWVCVYGPVGGERQAASPGE